MQLNKNINQTVFHLYKKKLQMKSQIILFIYGRLKIV